MLYSAQSRDFRLVVAGDSLITRPMSVFSESRFTELVDLIRSADAAVTNAEMLFHDYEHPPAAIPGGSYMRADPRMVDELAWMGFSLLAAANNHAYDFGENGLLTHLRHLEGSGLTFAGIGRNMAEAREPRYLDTPAGRVALVAVTSSGPPALYAGHRHRDGRGRPGANMIRHTVRYTVDAASFTALRTFRDKVGLRTRPGFGDHSLGASAVEETDRRFYLPDLQDMWQYGVPAGYVVELGDGFGRTLVPDRMDLEENLQRIRDARRMADWVVVSMHNHEDGETADLPSDVAVEFAHAAIDAGADVFHGHGPHRDRGIEIYCGKPIFYSLGHFVFQNDTIDRVPLDNFVRQGLDPWESTPADFYDARSGRESEGEWLRLAGSPAAWRDALGVVEFKAGELAGVELVPIDLGFQLARAQRGRPLLANMATSTEVIRLFQRLSAPFNTTISQAGTRGVVHIPVAGSTRASLGSANTQ